MKARPGLLVAAILTLAIGGASTWWRAGVRREREGRKQALQEQQTNLQARLHRQEEAAVFLARERDQLRADLAGRSLAATSVTHARKPVETYTPAQAEEMLRFFLTPWQDLALRDDPALRSQYLTSERINLEGRYGPLLGQLGLSPEQTAKFKELLVEHAQELLELRLAALPGAAAGPKTDIPSRDAAEERLRTAQTDLLGDAGYRQLRQYERLLPVRYEVDTLAGSLALTNVPLDSAQAGQLVQIIANASNTYRQGGDADTPMPGNGEQLTPLMLAHQAIDENIDWNSVLTQARGVLSPDQFELFSNQIGRNQTVVRLYNLIHDYPGDPMVGFTFGRR